MKTFQYKDSKQRRNTLIVNLLGSFTIIFLVTSWHLVDSLHGFKVVIYFLIVGLACTGWSYTLAQIMGVSIGNKK